MIRVGHLLWEWRGRRWAHLWDTDGDRLALVEFGKRIGLKPEWIQTGPRKHRELMWHYDVTGTMYERALQRGAVLTDELEYWREKQGLTGVGMQAGDVL